MIINHYSLIKPVIFNNNEGYLTVHGNSMWPLLKDGQRVRVSIVKKPLKKSKCYLFIYKNSLYIHRLFEIQNDRVLFIGDYSEKIEEVSKEAIVGELKLDQNRLILFVLSVLNDIFIKIAPGFLKGLRIRKKIFSIISKLEKKQ